MKLNIICSHCLVSFVQLGRSTVWQCPRCKFEVVVDIQRK